MTHDTSPAAAPATEAAPTARGARVRAALRRAGPAALLVVQSLTLGIVLSWPTLPLLATSAVGSAATDTPKHVWTLWWMRRELFDGTAGLATRWVNFPEGMDLFPISPLDGLLYAALPVSPVVAANVLALLHLTLLGAFAGWLGREVVGTRAGAHVAAALAQGAAFTGFALEVGVGELRLAWWIPLGLACLVRAHRVRTRTAFVTLGLVLAAAVLSCFYHGLFLATSTAVWALATLERRRDLLIGYALAAGLSLLVVLPVIRAFSASYAESDGLDLFPGASVSLEELLSPDLSFVASDLRSGYGAGRYLGVGVLVLAALGVAADRRRALPWLAVAGVCVVLALGPVLQWGGEPVRVGGLGFALPMRYLNQGLAAVGEPVNFPSRFLAPAGIALAVLGALATRRRVALVLVPLALLDVLANDVATFPRAVYTPAPLPGLARARGTGGVVDLSMLATSAEPVVRNRSIAAQLLLNQPFATVPVERLVAWGASSDRWLRAVPLITAAIAVQGTPPVDPRQDWSQDLWLLREHGYDRLLFTHVRATPDANADTLLTSACGAPFRTEGATVWTIPVVRATAPQAASWRARHADRMAAPIVPTPRTGG